MLGPVRRKTSNVRAMQLFHELKQQFPTLPDHVVSECIARHRSDRAGRKALIGSLEDALAHQELMGRVQQPPDDDDEHQEARQEVPEKTTTAGTPPAVKYNKKEDRVEDILPTDEKSSFGKSSFYVKRPNTLNLNLNPSERCFNNIQPSGKCNDVHKLLNSELANRPPRSPQTAKRFGSKSSPKKETADTPTQTTDTLLGNTAPNNGNNNNNNNNNNPLNLSVNVNCSMDVQTPTNKAKCTTSLQLVPQRPWDAATTASPRSFTSVSLTLRPPSSEPQPPIDITSRNSSLTYSTSSFDPANGLQSKLQITVGPGGGVRSMRTRPRSSYHPDADDEEDGGGGGGGAVPNRAGSMVDLRCDGDSNAIEEVPLTARQQVRIDKLRIELKTEKCKLVALQREVTDLEGRGPETALELDEVSRLELEVLALQEQCSRLTQEIDRQPEPVVPQGVATPPPIGLGFPVERAPPTRPLPERPSPIPQQQQHPAPPPPYARLAPPLPQRQQFGGPAGGGDGPRWNCHMCTFQNHPLLERCEQCEMPRMLHGKHHHRRGDRPAEATPSPTVIRNYDHVLPNLYYRRYDGGVVNLSPTSLPNPYG